jgi:hypothetical protein
MLVLRCEARECSISYVQPIGLHLSNKAVPRFLLIGDVEVVLRPCGEQHDDDENEFIRFPLRLAALLY